MNHPYAPVAAGQTKIDCQPSIGWLSRNITETLVHLADRSLGRRNTLRSSAVSNAASKLLTATVRNDFNAVIAVSDETADPEEWRTIAHATVERLENDWVEGRLTTEHAASAYWNLQRAIERRSNHVRSGAPDDGKGARILLATLETELHSFGVQLMADHLGEAGFHVELAIQSTGAGLLNRIATGQFDILGVSLGCDEQLVGLANLIVNTRSANMGRSPFVVVGGQVFSGPETEYSFLGADRVCTAGDDFGDVIGAFSVAPAFERRIGSA